MSQGPIGTTIAVNPSGFSRPAQLDITKSLVTSINGPLYGWAAGGLLFQGANQTGVTTSAGLATTYVGCCLSNPAASTVDLIVLGVSVQFNVAPAAFTAIGLIQGWSSAGVVTHTTALTPVSTIIGGASPTPAGKLDSAATIVGTPAWMYPWLSETPATTTPTYARADLQALAIIKPGGYIATGTSIAGPTSGFLGAFLWAERAAAV